MEAVQTTLLRSSQSTETVSGRGWSVTQHQPVHVEQLPTYDLVSFVTGTARPRCLVSVGAPERLLDTLGHLLPRDFMNVARIADFVVGNAGDRPMFALALVDGKRSHLVVAVYDAERVALCAHEGIGQSGEFFSDAGSFLVPLRWELPLKKYSELSAAWHHITNVETFRLTVQFEGVKNPFVLSERNGFDMLVGFDWSAIVFGDDGTLHSVERVLVAYPGQKLSTIQDTEAVQFATTDGSLQQATWRHQGPDGADDLSLVRTGPGKYELWRNAARGSVKLPFSSKGDLAGPFASDERLFALLGQRGPTDFTLSEFDPGLQKDRPTEYRYTRKPDDPRDHVTVTARGMSNDVTIGGDGRAEAVRPMNRAGPRFVRATRTGDPIYGEERFSR